MLQERIQRLYNSPPHHIVAYMQAQGVCRTLTWDQQCPHIANSLICLIWYYNHCDKSYDLPTCADLFNFHRFVWMFNFFCHWVYLVYTFIQSNVQLRNWGQTVSGAAGDKDFIRAQLWNYFSYNGIGTYSLVISGRDPQSLWNVYNLIHCFCLPSCWFYAKFFPFCSLLNVFYFLYLPAVIVPLISTHCPSYRYSVLPTNNVMKTSVNSSRSCLTLRDS